MSSFAYLPLSDTTVFQGQSSSDTTLWVTGVWTVSAGQSPSKINGIYSPQEFVVVSGNSTDTEKACFMCYSDDMFSNSAICCTNGVATSVTTARFGRVPFDLFASNDGLLWFRSEPREVHFTYQVPFILSIPWIFQIHSSCTVQRSLGEIAQGIPMLTKNVRAQSAI